MSSDALFQLGMDLDHGSSTAQTEEKLSRCLSPDGEGRKEFFCERDGVRYAGTHLIIDLVRAERLDDLERLMGTSVFEDHESEGTLPLATTTTELRKLMGTQ